jgi:hypothetical protein
MARVGWSLITFDEQAGRARETRHAMGYAFLDAAKGALAGRNGEWFVSARMPDGSVLAANCVRALLNARAALRQLAG